MCLQLSSFFQDLVYGLYGCHLQLYVMRLHKLKVNTSIIKFGRGATLIHTFNWKNALLSGYYELHHFFIFFTFLLSWVNYMCFMAYTTSTTNLKFKGTLKKGEIW